LRWARAVDLTLLPASTPSGSPLAEAIDAIGTATRAVKLTLGIRAGPSELAVALTGGLLSGAPRDPPGF
jgi:hypothetical protein